MKITILTTFPEMFTPLHTSMLGRAEKAGILEIREVDIRAYSKNKHHNTDDAPFGGGQGMLMKPAPIFEAVNAIKAADDRPAPSARRPEVHRSERPAHQRHHRRGRHRQEQLPLHVERRLPAGGGLRR